MNAKLIYIQSSFEIGDRNEKRSGIFLTGRLYKILMPKFRNGSVKSMACSLEWLMVSAATAKSAFYKSRKMCYEIIFC